MCRNVFAVLALLALTAACSDSANSNCSSDCITVNDGGPMIHGSGTVKTETRSVDKFTAIQLQSGADAVIEGGAGAESLSVTADDNLLPLITTEVKDGTLILSLAKGKSFEGKAPLYRVTVGDLRSLDVAGSGRIKASKLTGGALAITVSGSGTLDTSGQISDLAVSLNGSGTVNAADLKAQRAKIVLSGSGEATVNASDELDVSISGSGTVRYIGSPKLTKHVSGSGEIKQKSP